MRSISIFSQRRGRPRPPVLAALALAAGLGLAGGQVAHASRFGPPWQAEVIADEATPHGQPDQASPASGSLPKGSLVVVLDEKGDWTQTSAGFVPTADLRERTAPWVAEV